MSGVPFFSSLTPQHRIPTIALLCEVGDCVLRWLAGSVRAHPSRRAPLPRVLRAWHSLVLDRKEQGVRERMAPWSHVSVNDR